MTVRLLTNIGRLWTGSEILSNAAIVTGDDRIAWVGPAAECLSASGSGRRHRRRGPGGEPGRRPGHARADRRHTHPAYAGTAGPSSPCGPTARRRPRSRRGRRRRVHRHRDPRHRPLDAVQRGARAAGPLAAVRYDDPRGQDRVPPDQGRRAGRRTDAARARSRAGHATGARHVHGGARVPRSSSAAATTTSTRSAPGAPTRPPSARTAWTCTAKRAGSPRTRRAGSSSRAAAGACCRGCTPAGNPVPARPGWPPRWAGLRRHPARGHRGGRRGAGPGRRGRRGLPQRGPADRGPAASADLLDKGVAVALGSDHAPGVTGITSMSLVIYMAVSYLG